MTNKCELSYGNVNTTACYRTLFSVDCESCQEVALCKDCVGCNSCFGSIGLRNKSYCIFNQEYSKEEYKERIAEFNLGSNKNFQELKAKTYKHWLNFPQKYIHGYHNAGVSGDYIFESKNAKNCFRVRGAEDSKFLQNIINGPVKDCYDYANYGENAELVYECLIAGSGVYNTKFCTQSFPNVKDLTYCIFCNDSSDLFGCISLRKKQYCIFNKQYTKEEYEKLVPEIIAQMEKRGEYGEFFPSWLSYFPYKATAAYEFSPLNEEDAKKKGFLWYPTSKQNYQITLKNKNIADDIKDIGKGILSEVIECAHKESCQHECTGAFRIIEMEFDFCKRINISLPRLCTNCRHHERLLLRNSPAFYHRQCMCDKQNHNHQGRCQTEFETSYAPDRPEKIYCESCYNKEVY